MHHPISSTLACHQPSNTPALACHQPRPNPTLSSPATTRPQHSSSLWKERPATSLQILDNKSFLMGGDDVNISRDTNNDRRYFNIPLFFAGGQDRKKSQRINQAPLPAKQKNDGQSWGVGRLGSWSGGKLNMSGKYYTGGWGRGKRYRRSETFGTRVFLTLQQRNKIFLRGVGDFWTIVSCSESG